MDKPLCSCAQFLFWCVTFPSRLVCSRQGAFLVVCVNADTLKRHKGKTSVFRALPVSSAGLGYRSRADVFHRFHTRRTNLRMRSLLQRLRNLRHSSVRMCKKELEKKQKRDNRYNCILREAARVCQPLAGVGAHTGVWF